jgi:hypothetical protein
MYIKFTRDEGYIDGFVIHSESNRTLDVFVSLEFRKPLLTFKRLYGDWTFRFWIFNVQYTADTSFERDGVVIPVREKRK